MARGLSRPNSLIIQEALNLLSALGSNSKGTTKKLLTEMKIVQDHNEVVLADAREAVENANKREAEVVDKEVELARDLKEAEELYTGRLSNIVSGEQELQRKVEEDSIQISKENEAINARNDELHREQEKHRKFILLAQTEFAEKERIFKEDREALKELESSFEGREDEITSDRMVLDDLRSSLDERKMELDKRDARVRAAMEGVEDI